MNERPFWLHVCAAFALALIVAAFAGAPFNVRLALGAASLIGCLLHMLRERGDHLKGQADA